MTRTNLHVFSALLAAVALSGCAVSSSPAETESERSPLAAAPSAPQTEATRVQAYLDSLYLRSDVRHSFTSKLGDEIDCVDFDAEPQVRAMRSQGISDDVIKYVPPVPESLRENEANARKNDAFFLGDPDVAGRSRACPANTVPHVRVTAERIARAGGFDRFLAMTPKNVLPPSSAVPEGGDACGATVSNLNDYAWALAGWKPNQGSAASNGATPIAAISAQGGASTLNIAAPSVPDDNSHSLQQVWLVSGNCQTAATVEQTVEVGNIVDPDWLGTSNPVLFVAATADYYSTTGCINGTPNTTGQTTCGWIPSPTASLAFGAQLTASVSGGAQHAMKVIIEHLATGWGVWVVLDSEPSVFLGTMPNSYYNFGAIGKTGLYTAGTEFMTGAEMYSQSGPIQPVIIGWPTIQIGEGGYPIACGTHTWDYGNTAFSHDFAYFKTTAYTPTFTGNMLPYAAGETAGVSVPYWVATNLTGMPTTWQNNVFYGPDGSPRIHCLEE